jgi:hypothetical protein
VKRLLFAFVALLSVPSFVAAQLCVPPGVLGQDQYLVPTPPDSTAELQNAVNCAAGGSTVFLDRGPNGQDTYVLTKTIVLPGPVTITKAPAARGAITIQAGTNIDQDTTTTFCDPTQSNPGTRNVFCSSGKLNITIDELNFIPLSGQTVVKNPPDSSSGREVWAVMNGGSALHFQYNTVSNFTDGLFFEGSGSDIDFSNNGVNLADRNGPSLGQNAAFTTLPDSLGVVSGVTFSGNTVVCPGSSIYRPIAIVGGIVFDESSMVNGVEMKNNRVSQCDHGLFISATGSCTGSTCTNTVTGNSGLNNGNGLTVSRGGNPPSGVSCSGGPADLPASGISITKNTFNSNGYDGACIAPPMGSGPFIVTNNILNGNQNQCLENYSGSGPTGSSPGSNICRGPGNNGAPPYPPGKGVNPGH